MGAVVMSHVDKLSGLSDAFESRFHHGLRTSREGHDRSVGRFSRIYVQHFDTRLRAVGVLAAVTYGFYNCVDYKFIAAFTEIRHAFYDSAHIAMFLLL